MRMVNVAGCGIPVGGQTGLDLVQQIRIWETSKETISEGAVALADWILEDSARAEARFADPLCPLRNRLLLRVLAGTVLPGEEWSEWLGRATEGRVIGKMFRRPFLGEVTWIGLDMGAPEPEPEPAAPIAFLCPIPGPLGAIPSGPLFTAIADPMAPGEFVLAGMGIGIRLSEAAALAMKRAIADGLCLIDGARG